MSGGSEAFKSRLLGSFVGKQTDDLLNKLINELADFYAPIESPTFTGTVKGIPHTISFYASDTTTAITAATSSVIVYVERAMTITDLYCALGTVQASGSTFTVDIKKNGVSILSTLVTIDNTERTSLTAAVPPVISTTSLAKGDYITVEVTQIGDGTAKQLQVVINGTLA